MRHTPMKTLPQVLSDDNLIQSALVLLEERLQTDGVKLSLPHDVCAYLRLQLGSEVNEVFGLLFLNNQHQVIAFEKLFVGTINTCQVHPRVIVQRVLFHNAAAVIVVHNHPSGNPEPSQADCAMTQWLKNWLPLIDVYLLDHIIVTSKHSFSLVEHGLM